MRSSSEDKAFRETRSSFEDKQRVLSQKPAADAGEGGRPFQDPFSANTEVPAPSLAAFYLDVHRMFDAIWFRGLRFQLSMIYTFNWPYPHARTGNSRSCVVRVLKGAVSGTSPG